MWLVIQGKLGGKLGKNYLILERLVGETFMNQWKNIYPSVSMKYNLAFMVAMAGLTQLTF